MACKLAGEPYFPRSGGPISTKKFGQSAFNGASMRALGWGLRNCYAPLKVIAVRNHFVQRGDADASKPRTTVAKTAIAGYDLRPD
jgi:hypothetical protein